MSSRKNLRNGVCVLFAAVVLAIGSSAWASFIQTNESNTTGNYNSLISATDLINVGQASLATASITGGSLLNGSLDGTRDGFGETVDSIDGHVAFFSNAVTFEYDLNTNPATGGSTLGYTISRVDCFAGWKGAAAFSCQSWNVNVKTLANPDWSLSASVNYTPFAPDDYSQNGYTHVRLSDATGTIQGVTALQFFFNPYTIVLHEIDVAGVATPEPGTLVLCATGFVGLLCYAWRKRK